MAREYHLEEAARYERLARECAPDTGALAAMPHSYYVDMAAVSDPNNLYSQIS